MSDVLAADQEQLAELAAMYADKEISAAEWRVARERIERAFNSGEPSCRA